MGITLNTIKQVLRISEITVCWAAQDKRQYSTKACTVPADLQYSTVSSLSMQLTTVSLRGIFRIRSELSYI